jgi:hypothetical protein
MANTKISALPEKALPAPTDLVPIVDTANPNNLATKKTTLADVVSVFKGVPNGIAGLNDFGKIPAEYIPAIAISETFVVNSLEAMLDLPAEIGDVVVRADLNKTFILAEATAGTFSNWVELLAGGISSANVLDGGNF